MHCHSMIWIEYGKMDVGWMLDGTVYLTILMYTICYRGGVVPYIYNYIYIYIYLTLSNHRLVTPGCRATVCLPSALSWLAVAALWLAHEDHFQLPARPCGGTHLCRPWRFLNSRSGFMMSHANGAENPYVRWQTHATPQFPPKSSLNQLQLQRFTQSSSE